LPFEPNSYKDFGGTYKLVARQPINASRQRRKGVIVDLDAAAGFISDLTYQNMQPWIEGAFFAAYRKKAELNATSVTATTYVVASGGTAYSAGDMLFAKNFVVFGNNGRKTVTASTATSVSASGLAVDASPGVISRVGFQFAAGDLTVNVDGTYPQLLSVAKDFTQLGLNTGEWIFIGGDTTITNLTNVNNNGWIRVKSVATHVLTFDKYEQAWADETTAASAQTVQLFCGRVVRNELAASDGGLGILQIPFQLERSLGAPDTSSANVQAEYITGALFNDLTLTLNTAALVTWDATVIAGGYETKAAGSQKPGTRPPTTVGDAYNSTSHVRRFQLGIVDLAAPLFAYVSDASLTFNNNIKPNKAVSVLGAFAQSAGIFQVGGTVTAYFANVAAVQAVPNNANATIDLILCQENQGISVDLPLVALGNGLLKVTLNEPITLPLTGDAGTAASVDATKDYTAQIVFYDYLPTAAM
jgi:hypothetical protein